MHNHPAQNRNLHILLVGACSGDCCFLQKEKRLFLNRSKNPSKHPPAGCAGCDLGRVIVHLPAPKGAKEEPIVYLPAPKGAQEELRKAQEASAIYCVRTLWGVKGGQTRQSWNAGAQGALEI